MIYNYSAVDTKRRKKNDNRILGCPIIGIDGEGATINGTHVYRLLMASNGAYIEKPQLSTIDCLNFIMELPANSIIVAYGFGYDTTMILRDLGIKRLRQLSESKKCRWNGFIIRWLPSRRLTVARVNHPKDSRSIYDTLGFYQMTFVQALRAWNVGTPAIWERIQAMKDQRSDFAHVTPEDIRNYCREECELLVQLTNALLDACNSCIVNDKPMRPKYLWGAGALGGKLLENLDVKQYMAKPPEEMHNAVLCAYFGGRSDVSVTGQVGMAFAYDINSAYPARIANLPCLAHGVWNRINRFVDGAIGVYQVEWQGIDSLWTPFPVRTNKRIMYPTGGKGWYWNEEVSAGLRHWPDNMRIIDGYIFTPACDHKPFAKVNELYYTRKQWKADNNAAERILKLALNSIYGKTAQTVGYDSKKPPTYLNLIWAGLITSGCRAQIYDAVMENPDDILSIATDGIISRSRLRLPVSDRLGDWEYSEYENVWIYQPGVYTYEQDGKTTYRNRGFGTKEIDWNALQASWLYEPFSGYEYSTIRFIPLQAAIHRIEYEKMYGQWMPQKRRIQFYGVARLPVETPRVRDIRNPRSTRQPYTGPMPTLVHWRPWPGDPERTVSIPYTMKQEYPGAWSDVRVALSELETTAALEMLS